jgi:mono/diheme cytochrome c family protein
MTGLLDEGKWWPVAFGTVAVAGLLLLSSLARAAEPALEVAAGGETRSFTRGDLLARPDAATIDVARDVAYGVPMTYQAVPVAALLSGLKFLPGSVIEAVAVDGFVAQIPLDLMLGTDPNKAVGWVAIEPADRPWPKIPGRTYTAGPFYIVWTGAEAGSVRSEYWAYQAAKLVSQASPVERWPQLAVDPALPANDPVRAGQALYLAQCLPCHKMSGAGAADLGPDLNWPMNPTEYMTPEGLHALIRDPKAVRSWPAMTMKGLPPALLSDHEIDLIVAYLKHMAGRKVAPSQNP